MLDIISFIKAKRLVKSTATGIKSYNVVGTNLEINLNDGKKLTMKFPVPADGISIDNVYDKDGEMFVVLSNGTVLSGIPLPKGDAGKSAYEIAIDKGFIGSEQEWLDSLAAGYNPSVSIETNGKGDRFLSDDGSYKQINSMAISKAEGNKIVLKHDGLFNDTTGDAGKSAYEIACENGYQGTELEWLKTLNGDTGNTGKDGLSAYELACEIGGFQGTELEWLASLQGADGKGGTFELTLFDDEQIWEVQSTDEGLVTWCPVGVTLELNESIENFDIIQFVIDPADVLSGIQDVDFEVKDIVYNPTEEFKIGGSRIDIIGSWVKGDGVHHSYGAYHTTMRGWFKDATHFYVQCIGAPTSDIHQFKLKHIIGIEHLTERNHDVDMTMSDTSENAIANKIVKAYIDSKLGCDIAMSDESTNPVENRVIKRYVDQCVAGIGASGGSGSGGSNDVYSIYETPIGTWHNGKTIYRKVFPNNDALRAAGGGKLDYTKKYSNQYLKTANSLYQAGSNHVWEYDVSTHNGKTIHITSNIAGGASIQYSFLDENGTSLGSVRGSTSAVKRTTTVPAGSVKLWVNSSTTYTPDVEVDIGDYGRVCQADVDELINYKVMKNDLDSIDREYLNFSRGLGVQIHNDAPYVKHAIIEYTKV